ncbi:MAG: hypothetical protein KC877_03625 [Candidatus Kaiserbacteria bacterium]|nr:hypothetical protein [Candidatus Kaiserbacteria bacterium]MCB9816788.1 hypothetical protein [Candidatus Nomurabacteria bacterium]
MEAFHRTEHDMELGCYIDEHGVIQLRMSGNLSSDHIEHLEAWGESVREAMRTAKERDEEHVYCIIDLVGGVEADQDSLSFLISLVRHNKGYATRTGVFGANLIMRNFMDIALKVAGRTNMKAFATREQAEHWAITGRKLADQPLDEG